MKALVAASLAALTTLLVFGLGLGFMTSVAGLVLAAFFAIAVGATVARTIEPTTWERNVGAIVLVVLVVIAGYILAISNQPIPPGTMRGGPNIPAPPGR